MQDVKIISKIVQFFLEKISVKLDADKLKNFNDLMFIFVENIIVNLEKIIPVYLDFYKSMTENEIRLANITNEDKILHIGCGSIPATSIYIVKKIAPDITAIDKNLQSIKKAQKLLLKLKLFSKIHTIHADALDFPLEKFNLIIISLGVKTYPEVLRYISQNMRSDAQVILRTSSSVDGNLVKKDLFLKDIFKIDKIIPQKKNGLMISLLLFKK